ncbi:hypothetical protein PWP93_21885 [Paraburkholderia sp. A1RI-2L]|uniref:hypothetical protein n=1 Tax=Paraburkholderia sp. A1RI-2L TaxID=3028367 RepID=UPI003B7F2949
MLLTPDCTWESQGERVLWCSYGLKIRSEVYSGNLDVLFCAAQQYIFKIVIASLLFVSCCAETIFLDKWTRRQNAPFEIMLCGRDAVGGLSVGIERYHDVYYEIFQSICARYCSKSGSLLKEMWAIQLHPALDQGWSFSSVSRGLRAAFFLGPLILKYFQFDLTREK